MADIQTYSPRKITDQNRDLLPTTHDPKKRTTYVQITLNESEIKEAIRNYIRAQVPVISGDELPVKIIAGRGENGHSAEITLSVAEYTVASPSRPTAPMATFEAVAEDAARRNSGIYGDNEVDDSQIITEEIPDEISFESQNEAPKAETPKAQKKSSLFDNVVPKSEPAFAAAEAAAAPPQTEHSKAAEEPVKVIPTSKPKSIFDV